MFDKPTVYYFISFVNKTKIPLPAPTGKRITYKRSHRGITALDKQIIPQDRFICHTQK